VITADGRGRRLKRARRYNSSISIAAMLWAGQLGSNSWQKQGVLLFAIASRLALGTT